MVKKIQKYLITISIVTVASAVLLAILAIIINGFFTIFNGLFLSIALSLAVICTCCFFANSAVDVIDRTKTLSIISLSLLLLATVVALLLFWIYPGFSSVPDWFGKLSISIALFSVFFTIVISINAKFAGHYKVLKYIYFSLFAITILIILLEIFGVEIIDSIGTIFVILCLVVFALFCVCSILAKRVRYAVEANYIKIDKTEFDQLNYRLKELEEENKELKLQLSKFEKNLEKEE